ncbi:ammonium transporter [Desulfurispira natronophila]|uniref:Ammonium transporter n=1 Tax=Desulfurispira natronophila TaxID=682562 RepID=A0A7W8DGZ3_9BACT|nr:ammonium transporter [Desulfurispira natronophila]MBB5021869.1 Amt family ammonium transporter [Desulfurispira natronophila]
MEGLVLELPFILDSFLMVFAGILVMIMACGFAMLESGLTRSKNTATIMTKNVLIFSIASVAYYMVGYNIMYGDGNAFMGSGAFLSGIEYDSHSVYADFFFQMVFVATAASVISGTVAERIKLWPFLIFVLLLTGIIYPIQGHWTWGESLEFLSGFSDYAGSTIVHSVGGWAALAGVLLLGARKGKYEGGKIRAIPGSNIPLATLGTFLLWFGWFGFNGGSALAMHSADLADEIGMVVASTNTAAATGAIVAAILTRIIYQKVDTTMVLNGALGGLVGITAGPDVVPWIAMIIGFVSAVLIVIAVPAFDKIRIDDPVGALSVHLVCGIWGTLAVGIFNADVAIIDQLKGIILIGAFVFAASFAIWMILKVTMGIRVDEETEVEGLDMKECGLEAYPEFGKGAQKMF